MTAWRFARKGIAENPHEGLRNIMVQADQDVDDILDMLTEFFEENPSAWHNFCHLWSQYRSSQDTSDES